MEIIWLPDLFCWVHMFSLKFITDIKFIQKYEFPVPLEKSNDLVTVTHRAKISAVLQIMPPSDFLPTRTYHPLLFYRCPASLRLPAWPLKAPEFTIPALN